MTIYYFSATGNSLAVAQKIGACFEEAKLISISDASLNVSNEVDTDVVGFVFPIHAWGMPLIVEKLINSISISYNAYIFAVATCAGTPGATLVQFDKHLKRKGLSLDAGFVVKEKSHSPLKQVPIEKFVIWLNRHKMAETWEQKREDILDTIENKKKYVFDRGTFLSCFLGTTVLHKAVINGFHNMHKDFYVENTCTLCQTCEKICPRNNISVVDGKIHIGPNCELCFACLNWCPKKAIRIKNGICPQGGAHNEDINLKDMLGLKRPN